MDVTDLVRAVMREDLLAARQWVSDAGREKMNWERVPRPAGLDGRGMRVAAGLVELLADRAGCAPPSWTREVGGIDEEMIVLDPGLERMPRSFARAKASTPEALRKRNLIALPDFLDVA